MAAAPDNDALVHAVHGIHGRSARESRELSESVSSADPSQRYGHAVLYAEMGRVCVCCVVLCVAVCVLAGRGVHPFACGGRKVLKGPRKVDYLDLYTQHVFFVFS